MMDNDNAQGNPAEELPQPMDENPEPTPSSNQPTEVDEESEALEGSKNPERTKAYIEKLKEENKRLKAEHAQPVPSQDYGTSAFDLFRPEPQTYQPDASGYGNLNQGQVQNITSQFIDQEGNVDINGLNQALSQANQRAALAEQRANSAAEKVSRFEETQQVREAHSVFPQIDPKAKEFDPKFFDLVRDRMLRNMWENKSQSLLDVAKDVSSVYTAPAKVNVDEVKEAAVTEYKQSQELRNQGPIETGRGQPRQETNDLDKLRELSRVKGEIGEMALIERIQRATSTKGN